MSVPENDHEKRPADCSVGRFYKASPANQDL
jgi:hypothetical protein